MQTARRFAVALAFIAAALSQAAAQAADLTLKYQQPATAWDSQALPIGNGRLGAMLFGDLAADRVQFNEISLWTGNENIMGAYQAFGNLTLNLPGHDQGATGYWRQLNLEDGAARVTYSKDGTDYTREYFASNPAGVIVVRLTASKPGMFTGSVDLSDMHNARTLPDANSLIAAGSFTTATGARGATPRGGRANAGTATATAPAGDKTMDYESQVQVVNEGGLLSVDGNGSSISFDHCDALTVILGARTSYILDYGKKFLGPAPHAKLTAEVHAATAKPFAQLRAEHVKDYQSLFGRVQYDLGATSAEKIALPTDKRLIDYTANPKDPGLEAIVAQYGRYLLFSCSRNDLPANLQGLWNNVNNPPWNADYHTNINIQMNYWSAEVGNLSEVHLPLFKLTEALEEPFRKATAAEPTIANGKPVTGWTMRTSHNIFGNESYVWMMGSNAWYAHHFWEHFQFTQDMDFLKSHAYPMMKEACTFWFDHLKTLPDGRLVIPNGWSPEHGPRNVDGVMIDQEMVWDLFTNTAQAADTLGTDKDFRDKLIGLRDKLATPKIGSWGQLCEWLDEIKGDPVLDTPKDQHRHVSHLWGVYPGFQINPQVTPDLAKAAEVSLKARGEDADSRRSWTWPWRCAIAARLQDGDLAHMYLQGLMTRKSSGTGTMMNMLPNLLTTHTPLQLDGNFGIAGAVPEMLLQSQTGEIVLLPALPSAWPTGSVKGLKARGAFEVDERWADGKLTGATIKSVGPASSATAKVRYGGKVVTVTLAKGATKTLDAGLTMVP